ncbi:hypothetical protein [Bacillus cereus group sp. BfR-BA-01380]|uniref:hypothetical protein n=1 Tax=Bacillus cereus group sp. BfR-BA-01380 TaxID=2920324 RepID=UPI001F5ABE0C|nr:hypothetical protein [Bacillus cereus group sp. BfR-BA-01380]
MEKEYRKRIDFSDKQAKRMWEYDEDLLFRWTKEICEYRPHTYFERKTARMK